MKTDDKWRPREALALERVIASWQGSEEAGSREARGDMATVRRLYGKSPEDDALAASTAMSLLFKAGLRSDCEAHSADGLTDGERAAVVTLALYAGVGRNIRHQDGGLSVGGAMGVIQRQTVASNNGKDNGDMLSVMKSIVAAQDFRSIVWDVSRALHRLDAGVTVDYAQLASDLTRVQAEKNRLKVLLSWTGDYWSEALDFYDHSKNANDNEEEE